MVQAVGDGRYAAVCGTRATREHLPARRGYGGLPCSWGRVLGRDGPHEARTKPPGDVGSTLQSLRPRISTSHPQENVLLLLLYRESAFRRRPAGRDTTVLA